MLPELNSPSSSHDSLTKPDSKQGHVDGNLKLVFPSAFFRGHRPVCHILIGSVTECTE